MGRRAYLRARWEWLLRQRDRLRDHAADPEEAGRSGAKHVLSGLQCLAQLHRPATGASRLDPHAWDALASDRLVVLELGGLGLDVTALVRLLQQLRVDLLDREFDTCDPSSARGACESFGL